MRFSSVLGWLNETRKSTLRGRPAPGSSRRLKRPCRPSLEVLEDRAVPATFTVTNLNDGLLGPGSLRQAIRDSNGTTVENDLIVFQPGLTGTITLTDGQLAVTRPVTITGPGSGALTISGNNASRIFLVNDASAGALNVAISGMTLTGGRETGIFPGGGIQVTNENLVLSDMVITGNTAVRGGGIAIGPNGRLTLLNSTVSNNVITTNTGAGLFLDTNSVTLIRNSTISGNTTPIGGTTDDRGGGGVLVEAGGFLTVESTTIAGNHTSSDGGGVLVKGGTLVVRNSTISGNSADGSGGGIEASQSSSLTVENSTISGNSAVFPGGGLSIRSSTAAVRNSTIAFNTGGKFFAVSAGGGISVDEEAGPATLTVQGTIVAKNMRGSAGQGDDMVSNTVMVGGANNLVGDGSGMMGLFNGLGSNQVGTVAVPLNPMLGSLANNGGTTQTHALLAGSPAINTGFNFAGQLDDQRGGSQLRTVGSATDIGAFEVQPALGPTPLPPPPLSPPSSPPPLPVVEIQVKRVKLRTRVDVLVNGALRQRFFPFGAFTGHVQIQQLDLNGDGLLDVIARAILNGKKRTRTFIT
jgi:parallel beta-helix repeat protein